MELADVRIVVPVIGTHRIVAVVDDLHRAVVAGPIRIGRSGGRQCEREEQDRREDREERGCLAHLYVASFAFLARRSGVWPQRQQVRVRFGDPT